MTRVLLQPAGGPEAVRHYAHTIRNGTPLANIQGFLKPEEVLELRSLYSDGFARIWGLTPGHANRNATKWQNLEQGDVVLFAGGGQLFASAFLKHKTHNRELAIALWGSDPEGSTWEYVYFVSVPRSRRIPYVRLADVLGFSRDFVVLGVMLLSEVQSAKVLEAFQLVDD